MATQQQPTKNIPSFAVTTPTISGVAAYTGEAEAAAINAGANATLQTGTMMASIVKDMGKTGAGLKDEYTLDTHETAQKEVFKQTPNAVAISAGVNEAAAITLQSSLGMFGAPPTPQTLLGEASDKAIADATAEKQKLQAAADSGAISKAILNARMAKVDAQFAAQYPHLKDEFYKRSATLLEKEMKGNPAVYAALHFELDAQNKAKMTEKVMEYAQALNLADAYGRLKTWIPNAQNIVENGYAHMRSMELAANNAETRLKLMSNTDKIEIHDLVQSMEDILAPTRSTSIQSFSNTLLEMSKMLPTEEGAKQAVTLRTQAMQKINASKAQEILQIDARLRAIKASGGVVPKGAREELVNNVTNHYKDLMATLEDEGAFAGYKKLVETGNLQGQQIENNIKIAQGVAARLSPQYVSEHWYPFVTTLASKGLSLDMYNHYTDRQKEDILATADARGIRRDLVLEATTGGAVYDPARKNRDATLTAQFTDGKGNVVSWQKVTEAAANGNEKAREWLHTYAGTKVSPSTDPTKLSTIDATGINVRLSGQTPYSYNLALPKIINDTGDDFKTRTGHLTTALSQLRTDFDLASKSGKFSTSDREMMRQSAITAVGSIIAGGTLTLDKQIESLKQDGWSFTKQGDVIRVASDKDPTKAAMMEKLLTNIQHTYKALGVDTQAFQPDMLGGFPNTSEGKLRGGEKDTRAIDPAGVLFKGKERAEDKTSAAREEKIMKMVAELGSIVPMSKLADLANVSESSVKAYLDKMGIVPYEENVEIEKAKRGA